MNYKAPLSLTALAVISALSASPLQAEDQDNKEENSNTVTIIGSKYASKSVAGSATVVDTEQLEEMKYSDATRALQQLPGVYIQQEDGLGLRPNIGLRGTPTERSGHINIMEDGVLIAPAPYAASSAYYFPTFDRIAGIEVLKGAASIKHGPFTVGGTINFLTRQIADESEGQIKLALGQNGEQHLYGYYTDSSENFGYLIEGNKHVYDGFKTITGTNNDTGFDKDDYVAKLRFNSDLDAGVYQQFDLKFQHSTEDSDQTYLGLSDADYALTPHRQYSVTQIDNFKGEHDQIMATYYLDFNNGFDATVTAYRNETKRNWFKLAKLNGQSLTSVINSVNANDANAAAYQAVLNGGDSAVGALRIRDNNRAYLSRGLQFDFGYDFTVGEARHELAFGARLHKDEEDRFQRDGDYTQTNGLVTVSDAGVWGNAGNRVQSAEAKSYYIQDTIKIGDWILTPGVRFEDVDLKREDWGKQALRDAANLKLRENSVSAVLPGVGALWSVSDSTSLLMGVNKGFAPPGNNTGDKEEESWNYEFGFRMSDDNYNAEIIAFINDYDNILGECTLANGCVEDLQGDKTNGGKAKTQGIELSIQSELAKHWPVRFAYTYTDSEFKRSFDSDAWGEVTAGDAIPYIPENQMQLSFGYDNGDWSILTGIHYVDGVCTTAACTQFQKTDDLLVVDLSAEYQVNSGVSLFATIDNVLEEDGIAGRQPYGARPVKDRHARIGVVYNF